MLGMLLSPHYASLQTNVLSLSLVSYEEAMSGVM